jgi:hypothetical protein
VGDVNDGGGRTFELFVLRSGSRTSKESVNRSPFRANATRCPNSATENVAAVVDIIEHDDEYQTRDL